MLTRTKIIKAVQKQLKCSYFIAEDVVDNLEYELCEYLDGNHFVESPEKLISNYVTLPTKYSTEEIIKVILN